MANIVFSKFFDSLVKKAGDSTTCTVSKYGIDVYGCFDARVAWPETVNVGRLKPVDAPVDVIGSILRFADTHDGVASVSSKRKYPKATVKAQQDMAVIRFTFQDGTSFDVDGSTEVAYAPDKFKGDDYDAAIDFTVDSADLARAFKIVEPCLSKNKNRPVLSNVCMDFTNGMVRLQTNDAFRLAASVLRGVNVPQNDAQFIVNVNMLKLFACNGIGDVRYRGLNVKGLYVPEFECDIAGWHVVAARGTDGVFPDMARLWLGEKRDVKTSFVCDVAALQTALRDLATPNKMQAVVFSISADGIVVTNALGMSCQVPAAAYGSGLGSLCVVFDAKLLMPLLTRVKAFGKSVQFFVHNSVRPVWIMPVVDAVKPFVNTGLGGEGYVLVPMRKTTGDPEFVAAQPSSGYAPCAPKVVPVAGLTCAPVIDFGGEDAKDGEKDSKPTKTVKRAKTAKATKAAKTVKQGPKPKHVKSVAKKRAAVEPEPKTVEIPEVPPITEPHKVVKTSDAVVVRTVVIPGGKSVRELADVFGMFPHRPRGFRDGKGRKVAYVAYDGTSGVLAYRDCYEQGSDADLESDIRTYLTAHGMKLAA